MITKEQNRLCHEQMYWVPCVLPVDVQGVVQGWELPVSRLTYCDQNSMHSNFENGGHEMFAYRKSDTLCLGVQMFFCAQHWID